MRNGHVMTACLSVVLLWGFPAASQSIVERGRDIAATRCGVCHATGMTGESPHRIAPPFRALHEGYPVEMLSRALRTGVVSGHDEMPMFEFSRADIDALLAYIDSLAPPGAPGYSTQLAPR